jgi:lipid II:glycine glycyltransferase (peptidoglycan interpeptide bridge formation enzyme)
MTDTGIDTGAARWQAWSRFVEAVPESGFMQSAAWARFRGRVGFEHFAITLKDGAAIVGGALVAKWTCAPGLCFYYLQEGPVLPADAGTAAEVFDAVLASVRRHAQAEGESVSHLRIEPRWATLPGFVRSFQAPPFSDGYREPRHTRCVDLRPTEDEILAQMKPKGRYNVRVAHKHGVVVVEDNSNQGLADFIRIQRRTAKRQGMAVKPPRYFRAMLAELAAEQMLSLHFAEFRGRRLATALVISFGRRATYFYGGSLVLHREVMAPYALQFEIMRKAKAAGCEQYDLWGIAPPGQPDHPWQPISEFKRKFGGTELQFVPTLDLVLDATAYARFRRLEGRKPKPPPRAADTTAPPMATAVAQA